MLIDLPSFALLRWVLPLALARSIAIWLAMTWNYFLNRKVTFAAWRSAARWRQYFLYCGSCLAGSGVSWGISVGLCMWLTWFAHWPTLAAIVGVGAGFLFNYALSWRFVFRPMATGRVRTREPV
jgi:dolichol-phosphate mannosyltransferase